MNVIHRNFFRLLRSGAMNEYKALEPMSQYKWRLLARLVETQGVTEIAAKGLRNHTFDAGANFPPAMQEQLQSLATAASRADNRDAHVAPRLSTPLLNRRLRRIQQGERHEIDASMDTLQLLNILVSNTHQILANGISLSGISELGSYLRTKGGKVDFVKLDNWLKILHIKRMAQLQGSVLVAVFEFEQDEIPFVEKMEPKAYALTLLTLSQTTRDSSAEWHFRQGKAGFVKNNSRIMRRNLQRSMRYFSYAPLETTSHFLQNFAKNLSEIEE